MVTNPAEICLRSVKSQGIVMSRVPQNTRNKFIALAEAEFSGDYGLLLKSLMDYYELWISFMGNWDIKLNYIINLLELNEQKPETEEKKEGVKMLSGKNRMKGGLK